MWDAEGRRRHPPTGYWNHPRSHERPVGLSVRPTAVSRGATRGIRARQPNTLPRTPAGATSGKSPTNRPPIHHARPPGKSPQGPGTRGAYPGTDAIPFHRGFPNAPTTVSACCGGSQGAGSSPAARRDDRAGTPRERRRDPPQALPRPDGQTRRVVIPVAIATGRALTVRCAKGKCPGRSGGAPRWDGRRRARRTPCGFDAPHSGFAWGHRPRGDRGQQVATAHERCRRADFSAPPSRDRPGVRGGEVG